MQIPFQSILLSFSFFSFAFNYQYLAYGVQLNANHLQSMFKKSVQQQLLSYHYSGPRKQFKNNKLNLFGKAIVVIDRIKELESLASIRELDLSHNGIGEIQNMEQFANVEFINLSHNRIVDPEQLLKLKKLKRLNTLYLKGNPFLRDKYSPKVLSFLLSLSTDIEIVSSNTEGMAEALSNKTLQNLCFSHYLKKIQNHIELINNYQFDDSFLNPDYAIFPKIKKIVEENLKQLSIKRQLIQEIDERCFSDEELLAQYLKRRLQEVENERSLLIKKIYDREQLLRNVRSTYHQRVVPKKTIPRAMNGAIVTGYFSPPKLQESRKHNKVNSGLLSVKFRQKYSNDHESSPTHKAPESLEWKEGNADQIMMNTLIKMNPLYHLLHSPLTSLKSNEKQLLIQNLTLHLKEKIKEVQRYEKKQQQLAKVFEEMEYLQQHFRQMSAQFKNEQDKTNQKLKKLSFLYQQESQRVQNLREQLHQSFSQHSALKQQNERLRSENNQLKQKIELFESQQELEDAIKDHFSKNLKKRYFTILSDKAYHLNQLKLLHELNRKIQQRQIKEEYFNQLKQCARIQKGEKRLFSSRKKMFFNYLLSIMKRSYMGRRKQVAVSLSLIKVYQGYFIHLMKLNYHKESSAKDKIAKMRRQQDRSTKKKVIRALKQQVQQKQQTIQIQQLSNVSKQLSLRKNFKLWKRYVNQHHQRVSLCEDQIIKGIKSYYLNKFITFTKANLTFKASFQAIIGFLAKMKKIKGYLNFSKTTSTVIFQRTLNKRKIEMIRQHKYLFWFVSTMRDWRIKKRIIIQHELQKRKVDDEQKMKQKIVDKQERQNKMIEFTKIIRYINMKVMLKIANREKNSMNLAKQKHQTQIKCFFTNLRTFWTNRYRLSAKAALLNRSPVILGKFQRFFDCLTINIKKQTLFKEKSDRERLLKCLYRWKFFNSWSKMQSYKRMYEQLGPQISHVSQLQKEVAMEKQLLVRQIEEKDRIVRNCQKKFEEYEYMLQSKDMKYQKLKDIYSDVVNQREMDTTVKLNTKERASEAEIYLKYLPQDLRTPTPPKYSFKAKIEEEDRYLKARLYSQPDNLRYDVSKEYEKKAPYPKGRESFLSSFKRF